MADSSFRDAATQVWRWAFLFAGFTPIYWLSRIMIHGLVVLVEYAFFTSKAIYYTYGVRVRCSVACINVQQFANLCVVDVYRNPCNRVGIRLTTHLQQ